MKAANRQISHREWRAGREAFHALLRTRTGKELARDLGVSPMAVSHWRQDEFWPKLHSLEKILAIHREEFRKSHE
jgi:transcriptional regulator with XRE-family HTH domain